MHDEILRVRIPKILDEFLNRQSLKKGMTKSEFVRCVLIFHYYGIEMNNKNFKLISINEKEKKNIIKIINDVTKT